MIVFIKALLFRIVLSIALAGCPIFLPFNLHAFQKQPDTNPQPENKLANGVQKIYKITFFSLKRGHSIAPSRMLLYDNGTFEIKIERENLLAPQGNYTIEGYQFTGEWKFTIKRTRSYQYVSQFKGLNVFNSYIIGFLNLKEYIEEQRLTQELPFIFFAALEDKDTMPDRPEDRGKNLGRGGQTKKTKQLNQAIRLRVCVLY